MTWILLTYIRGLTESRDTAFVFDGPLSELSVHQKADWLGTRIDRRGKGVNKMPDWAEGEKEDPTKDLDKFASYTRKTEKKKHCLKQKKQGKSKSFDYFVKDLRLLLMACEYTEPDRI